MPDSASGIRKYTGPISKRGKERSARNAVKHGLNVATTHINDPLFQAIAGDLLALGYGYEQTVEAANALLEYRSAMQIYARTYWSTEYQGEGIEMMVEELLDQVMASKSVQLFKQAQKTIKTGQTHVPDGRRQQRKCSDAYHFRAFSVEPSAVWRDVSSRLGIGLSHQFAQQSAHEIL